MFDIVITTGGMRRQVGLIKANPTLLRARAEMLNEVAARECRDFHAEVVGVNYISA